ncbi:hypothetical protein K5549_010034 [Capra hircus]|nr:hypothetical protein K5549_010034 [Capra hircus]
MGSGNPPSQTNALNKDILAQEGLLGAILLNNQHLIREHESLLKILLGSKALPAGKDHLLEAAGSLALEGLLCKGSLGGICGHGSLDDINDVLKSTVHFGKLNSWLNIINFDIIQVSWKVYPLNHFQLQFQTKLTISFPKIFSFLGGSKVGVTIEVPLEMPQIWSNQVPFTPQNSKLIFTRMLMRAGQLSAVIEVMLRQILPSHLPNMLCPVVLFWMHIINQQLSFLKHVQSFGLFRNLHSPFSRLPTSSEPYYCLDFQDKHFPASYISWLIEPNFFSSHI